MAPSSPTKLSPEEKSRLKAEQAAHKARLGHYKKVAKVLKGKDVGKRDEIYQEIRQDIELLTTLSSGCLEAFLGSLAVNKKNGEMVTKVLLSTYLSNYLKHYRSFDLSIYISIDLSF